jgi:hypothetical protein
MKPNPKYVDIPRDTSSPYQRCVLNRKYSAFLVICIIYRVIRKSLREFDLCGTVVEMVTLKGSMSTEGEALQVSVRPYRCSISTLGDAADVNPVITFLPHTLQQ